jgi:hypothetical protein
LDVERIGWIWLIGERDGICQAAANEWGKKVIVLREIIVWRCWVVSGWYNMRRDDESNPSHIHTRKLNVRNKVIWWGSCVLQL